MLEEIRTKLIKATGYHETLKLVKNSIHTNRLRQNAKKAFWLKTPCISPCKNTELTKATQLGPNTLELNRKTIGKVNKILENEEQIKKK